MRNVVGILLAAAVGIHCSASPDTPESSASSPELVAASGAPQTEPPAEPKAGDFDQKAQKAERSVVTPDFSPLVPVSATTHITSTVMDLEGASYATGTFEGRIVIGRVALQSRGDKDVFLIKVDRTGQLEWARAVGSGLAESGPRVTLEDGTSRIHLVGSTKGRMDCGDGPLSSWSSDTFFFCVFGGVDGAPIAGGVFPTGAP